MAQHILVPKEGVAIHINAFNFPIWGMLGEMCRQLAGWCAGNCKTGHYHLFSHTSGCKEIIASGILPDGALQLLCGSAGDLLDHVGAQDVVHLRAPLPPDTN